jgi:hypothetical protein
MPKKGNQPATVEFKSVTVRSRRENEDIKSYVDEVARVVGIHHAHRGCEATSCDLMLPANNEKGIGY